jgi:hypothetical protein
VPLLHPPPPFICETVAQPRRRQQCLDTVSQAGGVADGHDEPGDAILDVFGRTAAVGDHHAAA